MKYLKRFFDGIQKDFRLFVFILILLAIYRVAFIILMSGYIDPSTTTSEIFSALWAGFRISLKTAGAVTLLSFVFVSLVGLTPRLRLAIGIFASLIFSILFMARFPYYRAFNSTFGMEVIQGLNDDWMTIFIMIVQEYGMFWRLPVAFILTVLCIAVLSRLLMLKSFPLPELDTKIKKFGFPVLLAIFIITFGIFARFGGSLTYAGGINWENAGVTSDAFLNECVLDDAQAIYRVRTMGKLMKSGESFGVDKENILVHAQEISQKKNLNADTLSPYLEKVAKGEKIPKPKHIFIILGENWMQWPMLGKYADLHISDGIKSIIAEQNAYYSRNFMPNGDFTLSAIVGLVTGLPEVNNNVNYNPKTFEMIYPSSMAPPFKELGYKVDFWYGGSPTWENISKMLLAQGFDNFYGYPDFNAKKQNAWGTKDENLFTAIKNHLAEESPTVHLIMTTTNHPPYNLDLEEEGFDFKTTLAEVEKLPNVEDAKNLTNELGHYWYMDKITTKFIREVIAEYPESLFIVTGDHAIRTDPSTHPTIFEHQSVPFVMFGNGIKKNILPADAVGGHTSIVPTIIELIAPKGFVYYSISPSLFDSNGAGFNNDTFITQNTAGRIGTDMVELLPHVASAELNKVNLSDEKENATKVIIAIRTVTWWLLNEGLKIGGQ